MVKNIHEIDHENVTEALRKRYGSASALIFCKGLKEGGMACCGSGPYRRYYSCGGKRAVKDYELCENPSDYVFFDSIHPTERFNQIISQLMWSGNQSIAGPYNLKTLFEE